MDLRKVEQLWRAAWMRALGALLRGPRSVPPPDWGARPYRVLFLRYERIGDLIMATGILRAIARSHPTIELDALVSPAAAPVLEQNPHVRRVVTLDRRTRWSYGRVLRELRGARYDAIVDGRLNHASAYTSTPLLLLASGARYRIGTGGGAADRIYNVRLPEYDRTVPYIEGSKALAEPFGVDAAAVDWQPELFLSEKERAWADVVWETTRGGSGGPRLLVNLSASEPRRRWADEHFVAVLRDVREQWPSVPIIVIGLPSEWERVHAVATAVGEGVRAEPTPDLRQALALVATAERVVTPDTSISHAVSAFRLRSVVLLKREHHPYAPWNTPAELVFWDGETIAGLAEAPVIAAVRRLLSYRGVERREEKGERK
jgi:ADP-heptose:LPS heptosyltransferase